jgi:holin-like protein
MIILHFNPNFNTFLIDLLYSYKSDIISFEVIFLNMLKPIAIVLGISFIGEVLHTVLPLPFPASVYGLIILFLLLQFKVVKLESIKTFADFLISIMPVFFVAPSIGLMETWGIMVKVLVPIILIGIGTTALIMTVTGKVSQGIIRKSKKGGVLNERMVK